MSAQRATKLLQLELCKTTLVHALKEHGSVGRIQFFDLLLQSVHDEEVETAVTFFTDEVWCLFMER